MSGYRKTTVKKGKNGDKIAGYIQGKIILIHCDYINKVKLNENWYFELNDMGRFYVGKPIEFNYKKEYILDRFGRMRLSMKDKNNNIIKSFKVRYHKYVYFVFDLKRLTLVRYNVYKTRKDNVTKMSKKDVFTVRRFTISEINKIKAKVEDKRVVGFDRFLKLYNKINKGEEDVKAF